MAALVTGTNALEEQCIRNESDSSRNAVRDIKLSKRKITSLIRIVRRPNEETISEEYNNLAAFLCVQLK